MLLHPEEFASLHGQNGGPVAHFGTHCVVAHPADGEDVPAKRMIFVGGNGFSEDVIALLKRRPEIAHVDATPTSLMIELHENTRVAPLVSLLVESGAEIDEVYRRDGRLDELLRSLIEQHDAPI